MLKYEIYTNDKLYDVVLAYYEVLEKIKNIIKENLNNTEYLVEIEGKDK